MELKIKEEVPIFQLVKYASQTIITDIPDNKIKE